MKLLRYYNPIHLQWALLLVIACAPWYNANIGSYGLYQIVPLPLLFFFVLHVLKDKKRQKINWYVKIFLLMIIQIFFFSSLDAERNVLQDTKVLIMSLIIILYPTSYRTAKLIYPLLAIVGVIIGYLMLKNQDLLSGYRLTLIIGDVIQDPTWITVFPVLSFCYGLHLQNNRSLFFSIIGFFLLFFPIYVVFLSGSRGSMFGMMLAVLVWYFPLEKGVLSRKTIIIVIMLALLLHYGINSVIPNINEDLLARFSYDAEDGGRMGIWSKLIPEYLSGNFFQLFFGRGLGSCVRDLGMSGHNIFLEQIYQMGIIGLFLLVLFMVGLFKDTFNCGNSLGLYILTALFGISLFTPLWGNIFFMIPVASVIYINNYLHRNQSY